MTSVVGSGTTLTSVCIEGRGPTFLLDPRNNTSYVAVLRLLRAGRPVGRLSGPYSGRGVELPPGAFVVNGSEARADLDAVVAELGITAHAVGRVSADISLSHAPRVALYQEWGGNMDEGWTRYVLDTFEWEPITIHPEDIRDQTDLSRKYDVILFPDSRINSIINGRSGRTTMPQYQGGINESGVNALKAFVEGGGTIAMLGRSAELAIEHFGAPFKDALEGVERGAFVCPGSILEVEVDPTDPIAWGMPERANVMYASDLLLLPTVAFGPSMTKTVVRFGDENPLRSGWIEGEEHIFNTIGAATVEYGEGQLVLLPLRIQRRAQTHGTFKLLFNPLINSVGK